MCAADDKRAQASTSVALLGARSHERPRARLRILASLTLGFGREREKPVISEAQNPNSGRRPEFAKIFGSEAPKTDKMRRFGAVGWLGTGATGRHARRVVELLQGPTRGIERCHGTDR